MVVGHRAAQNPLFYLRCIHGLQFFDLAFHHFYLGIDLLGGARRLFGRGRALPHYQVHLEGGRIDLFDALNLFWGGLDDFIDQIGRVPLSVGGLHGQVPDIVGHHREIGSNFTRSGPLIPPRLAPVVWSRRRSRRWF